MRALMDVLDMAFHLLCNQPHTIIPRETPCISISVIAIVIICIRSLEVVELTVQHVDDAILVHNLFLQIHTVVFY